MYKKTTHIHFIGIGGIGMSGIAQILHYKGYRVSGCDENSEQKSIHILQALGCTVHKGNNQPDCNDPSINVVVHSSAFSSDSPELNNAQQRGIPVIHRADMLAELMRTQWSIAVSGSHGKTTTSSLLAHILLEADFDPTIAIGGHLHSIDNNARLGNSEFFVAEADESDRSLLKLSPTIAIVTNIDLDHLETYHNQHDITHTMQAFLERVPFYGKAIVCIDDANIRSLLPLNNKPALTYGCSKKADWRITNLVEEVDSSTFMLERNQKKHGPITLSMPGKCNVLNAVAALIAAEEIGVPFAKIIKALASFAGIDRRFTFKGIYKGAEIFDDYGHHPAEIKEALAIARKKTKGKLRVLFQPHRYSRTQMLWNEFLQMFLESDIDELIMTDIYPASEKPIKTITSQHFATELKKLNPLFTVTYQPLEKNYHSLLFHLSQTLLKNDLLILQGAGPANKLADQLIERI